MNLEAAIFAALTCFILELMGSYLNKRNYTPTSSLGWCFPLEAPRTIYLFIRELCK